jgi:hypothetical protein
VSAFHKVGVARLYSAKFVRVAEGGIISSSVDAHNMLALGYCNCSPIVLCVALVCVSECFLVCVCGSLLDSVHGQGVSRYRSVSVIPLPSSSPSPCFSTVCCSTHLGLPYRKPRLVRAISRRYELSPFLPSPPLVPRHLRGATQSFDAAPCIRAQSEN